MSEAEIRTLKRLMEMNGVMCGWGHRRYMDKVYRRTANLAIELILATYIIHT